MPDSRLKNGGANEYFRNIFEQKLYGERTIFVVAPDTPEVAGGAPYRRLGFVVAFGKGVVPGTLLSSPTTRTPGLVANVDIAPTITERYGAVIPGAAGQPVRAATGNVWQMLNALDRAHNAAARSTTPVLASYGIFAGLACLFALWAMRGSAKAQTTARFGLLTAASVLPALLPIGILAPQTAPLYCATLAAIALVIAGAANTAANRFRTDALRLVFVLLLALVVADTVLHWHMVEHSLLSAATLTGIRFYGIGNEWFGLIVGAALTLSVPWYVGAGLIGVIGLPFWGADAGGTLAATTAFAALHGAKAANRFRWWYIAAAFALAVVVTATFALLDRWLPGAARSHLGAAVAQGQGGGGFRALAEVASRKLAMNAGLLLKPWTWLAASGVGSVGFLVAKRLPTTSDFARTVLPAALCGAVIALLFNDGGVAAGLLLLVPVIVRFLYDANGR